MKLIENTEPVSAEGYNVEITVNNDATDFGAKSITNLLAWAAALYCAEFSFEHLQRYNTLRPLTPKMNFNGLFILQQLGTRLSHADGDLFKKLNFATQRLKKMMTTFPSVTVEISVDKPASVMNHTTCVVKISPQNSVNYEPVESYRRRFIEQLYIESELPLVTLSEMIISGEVAELASLGYFKEAEQAKGTVRTNNFHSSLNEALVVGPTYETLYLLMGQEKLLPEENQKVKTPVAYDGRVTLLGGSGFDIETHYPLIITTAMNHWIKSCTTKPMYTAGTPLNVIDELRLNTMHPDDLWKVDIVNEYFFLNGIVLPDLKLQLKEEYIVKPNNQIGNSNSHRLSVDEQLATVSGMVTAYGNVKGGKLDYLTKSIDILLLDKIAALYILTEVMTGNCTVTIQMKEMVYVILQRFPSLILIAPTLGDALNDDLHVRVAFDQTVLDSVQFDKDELINTLIEQITLTINEDDSQLNYDIHDHQFRGFKRGEMQVVGAMGAGKTKLTGHRDDPVLTEHTPTDPAFHYVSDVDTQATIATDTRRDLPLREVGFSIELALKLSSTESFMVYINVPDEDDIDIGYYVGIVENDELNSLTNLHRTVEELTLAELALIDHHSGNASSKGNPFHINQLDVIISILRAGK